MEHASPLPGGGKQGKVLLSVQNLTKRFGNLDAVDSLSFEVAEGEIIGFIGPNGAGKSTTLKMLTGLLIPTSGTARVCGFDLLEESIEVKRRIGFVPESGAVFESLTGLEYLEMIAGLYSLSDDKAAAAILRYAKLLDIEFEAFSDKLLGAYSKGMRRKIIIVAALLHNPSVIYLDEPLDGLDVHASIIFKNLLKSLAEEGKAIIFSSHILDVVERLCNRILLIDKGQIVLDSTPEELILSKGTGELESLFARLTRPVSGVVENSPGD